MTAKDALRQEFADQKARRDYAEIFLNSAIALQIKVLRQQKGREWDQEELAKRAGLHQSQISAMEKSTHNAWTLRTLKKLAHAFDLALVVRFESYGELLDNVTSMGRQALERPSFPADPAFKAQAEGVNSTPVLQAGRVESVSTSQPLFNKNSTTFHRYEKVTASSPQVIAFIASGSPSYPHTGQGIGRTHA